MQFTHGHTAAGLVAGDLPVLSTSERRTLDAIFRHPLPHNLEWSQVLALMERIGEVEQKANSAFGFKIGDERHIMHKPHSKDLPTSEIIDLRHFMTRAGWSPDMPAEALATPLSAGPCLLVAIDHHGAKLYHIDTASEDASEHVIRPYDPRHFLHHMRHKDQSRERGQKQAEDTSYYVRIAESLASAGRIVLVGHGKGASDAGHHLAEYLREHHRDIHARIAAEVSADLSALTDAQLLSLGAQALKAMGDGRSTASRPGSQGAANAG